MRQLGTRALLVLALSLSGTLLAAQRAHSGRFDPTTGGLVQPGITIPFPAAGVGGEVIGYTTDAAFPHELQLTDLACASADLLSDGHTLVPVDALAPGSLDGIDRLVVGLAEHGIAAVTPAQVDVIEEFVRAGGKLVFLGENNTSFLRSNRAIGGRFGMIYSFPDPGQVVLTHVNSHPITDGPFGKVSLVSGTINAPAGFGSIAEAGPNASSLVDFDNGYSATVVIEPNALAPGSGVVVAFSELNIFLQNYFDGDNRALWRNTFVYGGRYLVPFETEDDYTTALVNGQDLATPQEFGRLFSLSSSGPNAGAAIFDSTPLGPNAPSQDRDLLVGLGNLLILQNSQAAGQGLPGIFDRPNDDQDGGTLTFDFPAPVEPESLVLVDIDAGNEQASEVTLFDVAGGTRVYSVPPRWTEDRLQDGPPGWRRLGLNRLDPQPGFLSTATVSESPGFDPRNVLRIEVHLGSSGAVDDLAFVRFCGPH